MDNTSSPEVLRRGAFVYYVGSVIFVAGIALLAAGTAFIMIFRIHYAMDLSRKKLFLPLFSLNTLYHRKMVEALAKKMAYETHVIDEGLGVIFVTLPTILSNDRYIS